MGGDDVLFIFYGFYGEEGLEGTRLIQLHFFEVSLGGSSGVDVLMFPLRKL